MIWKTGQKEAYSNKMEEVKKLAVWPGRSHAKETVCMNRLRSKGTQQAGNTK